MTLRIPAKVLLHVWSYDFYDMTLSTGKQRRHMIKLYSASCSLQDMGEILGLLQSGSYQDRKEGLVCLQKILRQNRFLS